MNMSPTLPGITRKIPNLKFLLTDDLEVALSLPQHIKCMMGTDKQACSTHNELDISNLTGRGKNSDIVDREDLQQTQELQSLCTSQEVNIYGEIGRAKRDWTSPQADCSTDITKVASCFPISYKRSVGKQQNSQSKEGLHDSSRVKLYSYKELVRATRNFNQSNKVGEGCEGSVYKGCLDDTTIVAVKVLHSEQSIAGVREFQNEVMAFSDISHENLVKLYGYCAEGKHRILVYSYVGCSLAQTLLGSGHSNIQFDWRTRVNICLGIAQGLAYLHHGARHPIIHREIKASNILLDNDLTPKISNFGVARLLSLNVFSKRSAGTLGYLAPEYVIRGQVTRKSDVYSFGVLLLEIICGRSNFDTRLPYEDQYLVEKIWRYYGDGHLDKMIDSSLRDNLDFAQACRFLKVGLLCIQDTPRHRPDMSTIVSMLTGKIDLESKNIQRPGMITELMDLQIRSIRKGNDAATSSTLLSSSISESSSLS